MPAEGPFTLVAYRRFLETAIELGFRFLGFDESPGPGPTLHLRHDVDNDPRVAATMAELEAAMGVRSTYFFMVRHDNYNLLASGNVRSLRRIVELGQAVGLHVVLPDEHRSAEEAAATIRSDAALLSALGGTRVQAFSFHNPSLHDGFRLEVDGFVNAYAPPFCEQITYLSDSNMRWRQGPPEDVLRAGPHEPYQILVHPYSYVGDLRDDRAVLFDFVTRRVADLLRANQEGPPDPASRPVQLSEVARHLLTAGTPTAGVDSGLRPDPAGTRGHDDEQAIVVEDPGPPHVQLGGRVTRPIDAGADSGHRAPSGR